MGSWDDDHRYSTKVLTEADLSAKQFHAVKKGTADNGVVLCGAGEEGWGILQDKPANGEKGDMVRAGISRAVAGAAVVPGARVMADANGRLVTATGLGKFVLGRAESAAAADGDYFTIYVEPAPYALPV